MKPGQRFYQGLAKHNPDGECALEHRGGCRGYAQAHHIYPRRLLRSVAKRHGYDYDEMVGDWHNGVLLCVRHHHRVEQGLERFDRDDMPAVLERFEADYPALDGLWPRIYQPGKDADETPPATIIP